MPISNYIEKQTMTIYVDTIWENCFIYLKLHLPRPLQVLCTDNKGLKDEIGTFCSLTQTKEMAT